MGFEFRNAGGGGELVISSVSVTPPYGKTRREGCTNTAGLRNWGDTSQPRDKAPLTLCMPET